MFMVEFPAASLLHFLCLLTVHLSIILVTDHLNAQILLL